MSLSGFVRDHATPLAGYPHVLDSDSLRNAFAMLKERYDSAEQFRSVLVLDAQDHLVGILALRDLLRALLPDYLKPALRSGEGIRPDLATLAPLWQEDCDDQCRAAACLPASRHASPVAATISGDAPLAQAVFLFATHETNILPIVKDGRVTGVLRIVNVMRQVAMAVLDNSSAS